MFKAGDLTLLILQGECGIGKTEGIKEAFQGFDYVSLSTHITPLSLHISCYENKDKPICLEDIDELLKSPISVSLMKQLTETRTVKRLSYHSTSNRLTVPPSFETTSRVLISCNALQADNPNMRALLSRGLYIRFEPTRDELLRKMASILEKIDIVDLPLAQRKEVLSFIVKHSAYAISLNLRHLCRGLCFYSYWLKHNDFDWKETLLKLMQIDTKLAEVLMLMQSEKSVVEQVKLYKGSRSSYFAYKRQVQKFKGK